MLSLLIFPLALLYWRGVSAEINRLMSTREAGAEQRILAARLRQRFCGMVSVGMAVAYAVADLAGAASWVRSTLVAGGVLGLLGTMMSAYAAASAGVRRG